MLAPCRLASFQPFAHPALHSKGCELVIYIQVSQTSQGKIAWREKDEYQPSFSVTHIESAFLSASSRCRPLYLGLETRIIDDRPPIDLSHRA